MDNNKKIVIGLCDYTGEGLKPWADLGYQCFAFDSQHTSHSLLHHNDISGGNILSVPGLIQDNFEKLINMLKFDVAFIMAYPPCTDLAVSGAAHFASKRKKNKDFQHEAMRLFALCEHICQLSGAPYFIENPVSVISTMWRKPDYSFHPWEYGGYLDEYDVNPVSELIPPRDAYPKKTCLWTGNGFVMPKRKPVDIPNGYSPMHNKLGGKSLKTKNIRSATPRGFAIATCLANNC